MSLRRRLTVVLVLGLSALIIAAVAIVRLLATTDAARARTAQADAEAIAQALAERVDAGMLNGPPDGGRGPLQTTAASVLRPLANTAGGYCTRRGVILAMAGRAGRGERDGGRHGVTPEAISAVEGLCAKARGGDPTRGHIDLPRGAAYLAVVPIGERGAAWAMIRLRSHGGDDAPGWPYEVALLAVAAAALAGITIDAMMALRRGAGELRAALVQLQGDLRAPVPRPRATELREIAAGLDAMAKHLADAHDRERALSDQLSRDQRLAALGRVAAGVAHEVRNPLAGMKLRLDMLARARGLDAASRDDVSVCLGEIARLNRLVESLLTVSRAKTLAQREVALGALADDRLARAAPLADRASVRLAREGDASALADPDTLAGALDNLLRNAVEASPPGGVVTARAGVEGGVPFLEVEDMGPGIPEDRRAELFEPFFTTKPEGTGLGLWISRLLLEAKGASLAYDRRGDRTRMRITFSSRA